MSKYLENINSSLKSRFQLITRLAKPPVAKEPEQKINKR